MRQNRITTLEQHMLGQDILSNTEDPKSVCNFLPIQDVSSIKYVDKLIEVYKSTKLSVQKGFEGYYGNGFSITGGYCRNYLLGVNPVTDIDVVVSSQHMVRELEKYFVQIDVGNTRIETLQLADNTMHILPYPYFAESNGKYHVFIQPKQFDFTINLACISATDGWLYAPAITMFDIKNKIIRPCIQPYNSVGPSSIMLLSVILRAIRFSLKYDMAIHNSILKAMEILFTLERDRHTVDDQTLYYSLKHLYSDSEELRTRFYAILRSLNFIDTERYNNFDDYFKYVKEWFEEDPRDEAYLVESPRNPYL